jgi:peroxiredoxin Q/BCP
VLEVGVLAPDFTLTGDSGEAVTLSSFRGKAIVLYFYPKDDTPGCTVEACGFRDVYAEFEERGALVLGVSPDDQASHVRFKQKYGLPFTLLADPDKEAAQAYGVWRERKLYGKTSLGIKRSTFVIDREGRVVRAMYGVKPNGHPQRVLEALAEAD